MTWPFSVKLLWAPIVDSVYSSSFGRRKSWLVPTQYAIGLFLFWLSRHARALLGDNGEDASAPDILLLTVVFMALNFLAATQDIAVDGWALTMLSRWVACHLACGTALQGQVESGGVDTAALARS